MEIRCAPIRRYYFFCPDGSYEIYDYRSPGELRIDAVGEALVLGHFTTGKISHDVVGGGSLFHRAVDLSPTIVYTPLGVENIYQPNIAYAPGEPLPAGGTGDARRLQSPERPALCRNARICPVDVVLQAGGRFAACQRLQLHAAAFAVAAAICGDVLARAGPDALWQLWRAAFARAAGSLVGG